MKARCRFEGFGSQSCLCICNMRVPRGRSCTCLRPLLPWGLHRKQQGLDPPLLLIPQSPAVIDSPLKLELRVLAPPRCTIKPSGTTVSVTASVTIALVPPDKPEVQLSSMTMVWVLEWGLLAGGQGKMDCGLLTFWVTSSSPCSCRTPVSAPRWLSGGRPCAHSWTCAGMQAHLPAPQCLEDNHTCPQGC